MREVCNPANVAEAHMLVHLLEQGGVRAFVRGEALTGAAGGLPVNLLRIEVADEDAGQARALLVALEASPSAATGDDRPDRRPSRVALVQDRRSGLAKALKVAVGVAVLLVLVLFGVLRA